MGVVVMMHRFMAVVLNLSGAPTPWLALSLMASLALNIGCAGPAWFNGPKDGDFPGQNPYKSRVFAKQSADENTPGGTTLADPNPLTKSLNAADIQRQQVIEQQTAKYQQYAKPKTTAENAPLVEEQSTDDELIDDQPVVKKPTEPASRVNKSAAAESKSTPVLTESTTSSKTTSTPAAKLDKPVEREAIPTADSAATLAESASQATAKLAQSLLKDAVVKPTAPGIQLVSAADPLAKAVKSTSASEPLPPVVEATATENPSTSIVKPSEAAYAAGDWVKRREALIHALQEEIGVAKQDPSRTADVQQLETMLRLQHALAGRRDDAAKPIEGLRDAEQEFWRSEALGLVDLLGPDRVASESRRYAVALKSLEEAESHLAAAGSLTLRNLALCRKVQDFGVVERFGKNDFTRNQEVLLYVEVRNFAAQKRDGGNYETELQGSFRILDRSGTARAERTLPLDKQTCANLRRDYYIAYRLYIPSELAPGSYTLELTIEDKKGSKSNNALLDLNITP